MKRHYYIIKGIVLLAAMLLAACSGSDSDDSPIATSQNEIHLTTNVTSMPLGTRATTIDDNTALQGCELKIDAYFNDTETKFLDGKTLRYDSSEPAGWKFWNTGSSSQEHYYWPFDGSTVTIEDEPKVASTLDFVGFCPYDKPAYIGDPTYNHSTGVSFTCDMRSYMTNTAQASVSEFLVGLTQNQTYSTQTASGVPLSFKHPFARIRFQLAASHPNVQINVITFKNLKTGGPCTFSPAGNSSWSSLTGNADLVMTLASKDGDGNYIAADINTFNSYPASELPIGGYSGGAHQYDDLIVIPQEWNGEIEVNASWNDWGDTPVAHTVTATIPAATWQPGYSYTYTFTITLEDLVVNLTDFTEQW